MRTPLLVAGKRTAIVDAGFETIAVDKLESVPPAKISFLLIDCFDQQEAMNTLRIVRNLLDQEMYLKPVLFLVGSEGVSRIVEAAVDGVLGEAEAGNHGVVESWSAKLEPVNARIEKLKRITATRGANIAFRVLRFLETRNQRCTPLASAQHKIGYIYPKLQVFFGNEDNGLFETLAYLESQRLVDGTFFKRAYFCTHCGCAFLNFFETCPDCNSNDLRTEELIHHFKCAYVGEFSDYAQAEGLVCPKCDTRLKHLGVDYDKASVVHTCNSCRNVFQEPKVMTACYNCLREMEPENQVVRELKTYTITSVGRNAARYGMDSLLQTILESASEAVPFGAFKKYCTIESERIDRYKISSSTLVLMRFEGIDEIYTRMGQRSSELFKELRTALLEQLRSSDVFCVKDENIFLILFTETEDQRALKAVERLEERVASLLQANLDMECSAKRTIHPVEAGLDVDLCVEKLLQMHDS